MENPQFLAFNEDRELLKQPRTIICTGLGRSGTSAVASLMEFLGIWVGVPETSRNRENKDLIRALGEGPEAASKLISQYNDQFDVWGFKAPAIRKGLHETLELFRNPMVIVPHRDTIGRLGRQMVSGGREVTFKTLREGIMHQRRTVDELERVSAPQLHLAFPLLATAPETALEAIAAFAGLPIPDGDVRAYMENSRERYLSSKVKETDAEAMSR